MKPLVYAILAAIVFANASGDCDTGNFTRCIVGYLQDLTVLAPPQSVQEFVDDLSSLLEAEKKAGFEKICTANTNLYYCLGDEQASQCMTVDGLEKTLNISRQDAAPVIGIVYQMETQCKMFFKVVEDNFDCILNVYNSHYLEFRQCASTFAQTVANDPSKLCEASKTLLKCDTDPYYSCSQEVGNAFYVSIAAGLEVATGCHME